MPWAAVAGAVISGYMANRAAGKQSDAANRAAGLTEEQYNQMRSDLMPWQQGGTVALDQLNYLLGLGPPPGVAKPEAPSRDQFTSGRQPLTERYDTGTGRGVPMMGTRVTGYTPGEFDQAGYDAAWQKYQQDLDQFQAATEGDDAYGSLLEPFDLEKFQESPAYQFNLSEGMKAINKGAAARGDYYAPSTLQDLGKYAQGTASNEFQNAYGNYNTNMENIWRRLTGMSESGRGAATQVGQAGAGAAATAGDFYTQGANAQAAGYVGVGNAINQGIGDAYSNYLQSQVLQGSQAPTYGAGGYTSFGAPKLKAY